MSFQSFGPFGLAFEAAERHIRLQLAGGWSQMQAAQGLPPLDEALRLFTPSAFWVGPMLALEQAFGMDKARARQLHTLLAPLVDPQPEAMDHILADPHRRKVCGALVRLEASLQQNTVVVALRETTRTVSFGPFTANQMAYVARRGPLFEYAAGAGYFLNVAKEMGTDVLGCDSNAYDFRSEQQQGEGQRLGIMDVNPWSRDLARAGVLLKGEIELVRAHAAGRTLVMSWPAPGSRYPVEVLRLFREMGGKHLLFKLGGYIGVMSGPGSAANVSKQDACASFDGFFEELVLNWKLPSDGAAPYDPWAFYNNLWGFERK